MITTFRHHPAASPRRRGFTLIELVLVLTLLALLMGAAVYTLNQGGIVGGAQEDRIHADVQTIKTALDTYFYKAGRHPTTEQGLSALVDKPTAPPIPDRWNSTMTEIPIDPWKQPYNYRYPAQKSKEPYDVWSIGKDGVDGTEDDIGNWKKTEAK
jgi:general secretion pathway protein G